MSASFTKFNEGGRAEVFAIMAILVATLGLAGAYYRVAGDPEWGRALFEGFWILTGSAVLSALFSIVSLCLKMTWYGLLLTLITGLSAGGLLAFAVMAAFRNNL